MLENVVGRDDEDGVDLELAGCVVVDDHGLNTHATFLKTICNKKI